MFRTRGLGTSIPFQLMKEGEKEEGKLHFDFVCTVEESSIASAISPNNLRVHVRVSVMRERTRMNEKI